MKPETRSCKTVLPGRLRTVLCACVLAVAPLSAEAHELKLGVNVGGILAGAKPRLAVSPQAAFAWRADSGLRLALHETLSILPAINEHGAGVYSQTSAAIGYGWKDADFSAGPSLALYSMPACNEIVCGRIVGLSPGGQVQVNVYLIGSLGLSVSANVGWIGGDNGVIPDAVAGTVLAGPVVRWSVQ